MLELAVLSAAFAMGAAISRPLRLRAPFPAPVLERGPAGTKASPSSATIPTRRSATGCIGSSSTSRPTSAPCPKTSPATPRCPAAPSKA
jgi:hypothetical protein